MLSELFNATLIPFSSSGVGFVGASLSCNDIDPTESSWLVSSIQQWPQSLVCLHPPAALTFCIVVSLSMIVSQFRGCILCSVHSQGGYVITLCEVLSQFTWSGRTLQMQTSFCQFQIVHNEDTLQTPASHNTNGNMAIKCKCLNFTLKSDAICVNSKLWDSVKYNLH